MKRGGLLCWGAIRTGLDCGGNGNATSRLRYLRTAAGVFFYCLISVIVCNSLFSHKEQQWDRKGVMHPALRFGSSVCGDPSCRDPHHTGC